MKVILNKLLKMVICAASLFLFLFLIFNSRKGFDITDESFYLLKIIHTNAYSDTLSFFGYYLSYLYQLCGSNIVIFRIAGIIQIFLLGTVFSFQIISLIEKRIIDNKLSFSDRMFIVSCLLIGISGYYYYYWLITPSYNWLSLFSILAIVSTYIAYDLNDTSSKNVLSLRLLVYSVLIAFFANILLFSIATAILPVSLIMLILLISSKKLIRVKMSFAALVVIFFSFFLYLNLKLLFGDISQVPNRVEEAMNIEKILDAGHSFSRLALININDFKSLLFSYNSIIAALITAIIFCVFCFGRARYVEWLYKVFLFLISILCIFWFDRHSFFGYDLYLILFIMLFFMFMYNRHNKQKNRSLLFFFAFCSLALSARFGSNAGVFRTSVTSLIFCFSALLMISFIIYKENDFLRNCISLVMLIVICKYFIFSYFHPYRLNAGLSDQKYKVVFNDGETSVKVDDKTKKWIDDLKSYSQKHGWNSENCIIDMTGASPGIAVILNSKPLSQPWLAGSYPGSDEYAYNVIKKMPRTKLEESWVLTSPNGKRKISESIFKRLNIDFPDKYEKVCELNNSYRKELQILWKPK